VPTTNRKRPTTKTADKGRARRGKPKFCVFCADHSEWVDYKDTNVLRRFMSDRGKIKSRSNTGTCAQHQRAVATAIKTARELALLPYATRTFAADKPGGRGRGAGGRGRPGTGPDTPAPGAANGAAAASDDVADVAAAAVDAGVVGDGDES
jgi:small subunit ribosomal protein S18